LATGVADKFISELRRRAGVMRDTAQMRTRFPVWLLREMEDAACAMEHAAELLAMPAGDFHIVAAPVSSTENASHAIVANAAMWPELGVTQHVHAEPEPEHHQPQRAEESAAG